MRPARPWRCLRSATWGAAVQAHLPKAKLLTYGGHKNFADEVDRFAAPSIDHAWEQDAVCGVFDRPGHGRLLTRLGLVDDDQAVELQFYLWSDDGSGEISDALDLGPHWGDDGEGRRVTAPGSLPLGREIGDIDPEPVASVARNAMTTLAVAVP